ncbi:MAG: RDD family protein [Pseudomonadota bacterium]
MHDLIAEPVTAPASSAQDMDRLIATLPPPLPRIGPRLEVCDEGWQSTEPAPWRRYGARIFDMTTLGVVGWELVGLAVGTLAPALHTRLFGAGLAPALAVVTLPLLVMPLSALLLGTTGSTPGKWLFGTRVTRRDGTPPGVLAMLRRELHVWVVGLGMGLPLVSLVTMLVARTRLVETHCAGWDAGRPWVVTHRPSGPLQWTLATAAFAVWIALRVLPGVTA